MQGHFSTLAQFRFFLDLPTSNIYIYIYIYILRLKVIIVNSAVKTVLRFLVTYSNFF